MKTVRKNKFLGIVLALLIFPISFLFVGCGGDYKIYYPDVPLDKVFSATLDYHLEAYDYQDKTTTLYAVAQKYETICGQERFVTYVEWREIGEWRRGSSDKSITFLRVGDKTFVLNTDDNVWENEPESTFDFYTFKSIYLNIADSSSFRYKMTSKLFLYSGGGGRELPNKYKTETTDEYIEYVCKDNEIFRISNNANNVLLKYDYDTHLGSLEKHNATFNLDSTKVPHLTPDGTTGGAPTEHVPYLNTITPGML